MAIEIGVPLNSGETYEAGAVMLCALLWPDFLTDDKAAGERHLAVCQDYLTRRAASDPEWAAQPHPIRPIYYTTAPQMMKRIDRDLQIRLRDRLIAAKMVVGFLQQASGFQVKLPSCVVRLSVAEMAKAVATEAGQVEITNIKGRLWRESKPVLHIAAAFAVVTHDAERQGRHVTYLDFIGSRELIKSVIDASREYEALLLTLDRLKITPESLVRLHLT